MVKREEKVWKAERSQNNLSRNERLLLQLRLQEFQHIQSMARGGLGVIFTLIAISLAGVSAFYTPIPVVPASISVYEEAIGTVPLPISPSVCLFTSALALLLSMVLFFLAVISLVISSDKLYDVIVSPDLFTITEGQSILSGASDEANKELKMRLLHVQKQFIQGSARIITMMVLGVNSFIIYDSASSVKLWRLFLLASIFLIPSSYWAIGVKFISKASSEESEYQFDSKPSMLTEALRGAGPRWNRIEQRKYETVLVALVSLISFLIFLSWISSTIFHYISN